MRCTLLIKIRQRSRPSAVPPKLNVVALKDAQKKDTLQRVLSEGLRVESAEDELADA